MNKKEQAEMAELRQQLMLARAVRTTEPVAPDLRIETSSQDELSGYTFNAHNKEVVPAWTQRVVHGRGYSSSAEQRKNGSATQRSIPLYSTRLLALRAMRHAIEKQVFADLAKIDAAIDKELDATS